MSKIIKVTDYGVTALFKVSDDEANTGVRAAFTDAKDAGEITDIQPHHYNEDGSLECTARLVRNGEVTFTHVPDDFKL